MLKQFLNAIIFANLVLFLSLTNKLMAQTQTQTQTQTKEDWSDIKRPIKGQLKSIGSYANGCIIGAKAMPLRGDGFVVIRSNRKRYFAHPSMIEYLKNLGKRIKQEGLPTMLVGDISMPGGGQFLTGHKSHQIGLDADIWLKTGNISYQDSLNPNAILFVDRKNKVVDETKWNKNTTEMLRLAATDPKVDRIFINPAIKQKLCDVVTKDRSWLRKMRPWYGHDAHFHVRLKCPKGESLCTPQAPVPLGDGCGSELASWFLPPKPLKKTKPKKPAEKPILCQMVFSSPERDKWLK